VIRAYDLNVLLVWKTAICVGGGVYVILSKNNDFMSGCFSVLSENVEDTPEFKDGQTMQKAQGRRRK